MNRGVMFALAVVTVYIIWLIVFLLVIEPWLRRLTEQLVGITIKRELHKFTGTSNNISLLEVLDTYSWRVDQPASLSIRFGVGLLRVSFWLMAVTVPLALGIVAFFGLRH